MGLRMMAIYTLPIGLLIAGAMIPRIGYVLTTTIMLLGGPVFTGACATIWRRDLLPRDAPGNSGWSRRHRDDARGPVTAG